MEKKKRQTIHSKKKKTVNRLPKVTAYVQTHLLCYSIAYTPHKVFLFFLNWNGGNYKIRNYSNIY